MKRRSFLSIPAILLIMAGCSSDSEDVLTNTPGPGTPGTCDTTTVTFAATITPLLTTYGCNGCHSGTAASGGFTLTSYNGVKAKVTQGRLFGAISHAAGFRPMPEGGNKMNDCDINKFRAWINRGALND